MGLTGDKVKAKKIASKVAPVIEGGEVSNESDALSLSKNIGYPVILKAVEGGGGRGLRIVKTIDELKRAFVSAKNESLLSFRSMEFVLKDIENPRHIEVQILSDKSTILHLGERKCSYSTTSSKTN